MTKKRLQRQRSYRFDEVFRYQETDLAQAAQSVGKACVELEPHRRQLELAALELDLARGPQRRLSPTVAQNKLKRVSAAARKLLLHLSIRNPADAPDGPGDVYIFDALASVDRQSEDSVAGATAQVGRLVEIIDAALAAESLEHIARTAADEVVDVGKLIVPKGHRGDEAINDWLKSMMEIYKGFTGKKPGTTLGGPLTRFVIAAGEPVGIQLSNSAWQSRIRKILKVFRKK